MPHAASAICGAGVLLCGASPTCGVGVLLCGASAICRVGVLSCTALDMLLENSLKQSLTALTHIRVGLIEIPGVPGVGDIAGVIRVI